MDKYSYVSNANPAFIEELYQIEMNLDIYRMSKDQIIKKLNDKFTKKQL